MQIIVLQKRDAPAELGILCVLVDLLDELLAPAIRWMGLAGKYNLHRSVFRVQDPLQALEVTEDERRPLVGRKAPRETDGERLGLEQCAGGQHLTGNHLSFAPARPGPCVDKGQQLLLEMPVSRPQHLVRDLVQPFPKSRVIVAVLPVRADILAEEIFQRGRYPAWHVDTIGDRRDGYILSGAVRPH